MKLVTEKAQDRKQRTPKGLEIPVPTRGEFMRDLKKVTKPKKSPARRQKK